MSKINTEWKAFYSDKDGKLTRQLKGIALSGYGFESDVDKSLEVGFELHLTKPGNRYTETFFLFQIQFKRKLWMMR